MVTVGTIAGGAMALAMIAAFLLGFAGVRILLGKADRARGALMLGAAAVLVANVLIWSL
ncbi:hypothetical protein H8M03_03325 [Sphingomonas sabuli]|uniref:Uncharacterized protein n=1 Tax=Sphingomonas sabuli TaxID=2764186 RepID=A0A7G9L686_9SPHN|nr:hypothetical protein [Sphingomonas sabuli]QNM84135.1 hypothetical protein H8M03_03325 [Sphingomonas sabuli]